MLLLVPAALAAWSPNGAENGCAFFLGGVEGKIQPVRAECDWPIPAEKLHRLIAATADHDLYFSTVDACDVVGTQAGKELAVQVHTATGMSDREVALLFSKEPIPGGTRYTWTKAPDQSAAKRGLTNVAVDTGMWEITSTPTGAHVVYELRYDPGGSVPSFLVRWFSGSGLKTLLGEMRAYAEKA
jgi:hypothetical protein